MKINEVGKLNFITFDNLENTGLVSHCFSTRLGGESKGNLASLNLGFGRGESPEDVLKNYEILAKHVGFDHETCVTAKQTHQTNVKLVDKNHCKMGILKDTELVGYDAMITSQKNVTLVTYHADCVPLYFVDTKNIAIGLAHAGWRGTVNSIAKNVIEAMHANFGTNPQDIVAAIGPSIGKCCFEVEEPVVNEFLEKLDFSSKFITNCQTNKDKFKIDLWGINREIMVECGVLEQNIEITNMCTKCNPDYFYSHRNMGSDRGSLAAFLMLK